MSESAAAVERTGRGSVRAAAMRLRTPPSGGPSPGPDGAGLLLGAHGRPREAALAPPSLRWQLATSGDPLPVAALDVVQQPPPIDAPIEDLSDEGRARKRAEQAEVRAHPERRAKGLVIVNTGNGKGKTTAALGLLLRAWGRDMRVVMLQFIKAKTGKWGEVRGAQKMGVEVIPLGDGFTWTSKDIEHDRALAREGWQQCCERIASGAYDVVILDELTYCLKFGWLDINEVLDVLRARPEGQHLVITGRDAPDELIEFADLVTEMREVKHPYKAGVRAQPGIEF